MKKDLSTKGLIFLYIGLLLLIVLTFLFNVWIYCQSNIRTINSQIKLNTYDLYKISQILENNYSTKLLSRAVLKRNNEIFYSAGAADSGHFYINNFSTNFLSLADEVNVQMIIRIDTSLIMPYVIVAILYTLFFLGISKMVSKNRLLEEKYYTLAQLSLNLSQKLAHDIRSPLSTLNLISSKISDDELRNLQQTVVEKINLIANEHLENSKTFEIPATISQTSRAAASQPANLDYVSLKDFFERLSQEYEFKKISIAQNFNIRIDYNLILHKVISKKLENLLYRSINNFVQNSVEATPESGSIDIYVEPSSKSNFDLAIVIADNGKGIPKHILKRLGTERLSFGKTQQNAEGIQSGNGIALLNARHDLHALGSELELCSTENIGTKVIIYI